MEKALQLLEQMVNIDSGTGDGEGMERLGEIIAGEAARLGFNFQMLSGANDSEHYYLSRGQGRRVLLIAHLDTVFTRGAALERPFVIEGDLARGPGVSDCKSGVATILAALDQLFQAGGPAGAIGCLFNTDEEIGSPGSRMLIEELARGSQAVLVVEPAEADTLTVARKGIGRFRLETFGKAAHSGSDFAAGNNAIWELAHKVVAISDLTDLEAGVTLNVGVIEGGSRANVVPDYAKADIDLRVKFSGQEERIIRHLRQITALNRISGVTARLSGGITRPPMERNSRNLQLYELLRQTGATLGLKLAEFESGGGSDANFAAAVGIPVVDGLGPVGGGHHSAAEYLYIPSLAQRVELLAKALPKILES